MNPGEVWGYVGPYVCLLGRECDFEHGTEFSVYGDLPPQRPIEWLLEAVLALEARWLAEMPQSLDTESALDMMLERIKYSVLPSGPHDHNVYSPAVPSNEQSLQSVPYDLGQGRVIMEIVPGPDDPGLIDGASPDQAHQPIDPDRRYGVQISVSAVEAKMYGRYPMWINHWRNR